MKMEEIVKSRKKVGLPTKLRISHEAYGSIELWAYSIEQAILFAGLTWECDFIKERENMRIELAQRKEEEAQT